MRWWLATPWLLLSGCGLLVEDFTVEGDPTDGGADGVALLDGGAEAAADTSASPDTAPLPDTADRPRSCLDQKTRLPSSPDGIYTLSVDGVVVDAACDMTGGGWTLVATRAAGTDGNAWFGGTGVDKAKTITLGATKDAVLDVDWTKLGFSEIAYELVNARVFFRTLTDANKAAARDALFKHVGTNAERPNCQVEGRPDTFPYCKPPPPPPGEPPKSAGWVYSPTSTLSYWAYQGAQGAKSHKDGAVGLGRLWVK
jgi:hypothetical protein